MKQKSGRWRLHACVSDMNAPNCTSRKLDSFIEKEVKQQISIEKVVREKVNVPHGSRRDRSASTTSGSPAFRNSSFDALWRRRKEALDDAGPASCNFNFDVEKEAR